MAYQVNKGKVYSTDVPPEEEVEDEDPHSVTVPLERCPHGYQTQYACYSCNPKKYLPVAPPSLYNDVFAWTPLKIGDTVCRRIRTTDKGVVTNITYVFTDSHHMRDIWVDFCPPNGRSTPYKPDELLTLKVQ